MQPLYPSLLLVEAKQFLLDVGLCFADVLIFVYGCKYCHELSYKSPISGMIFIDLEL